MDTRKAVFAGSWYPERETACAAAIDEFLEAGPHPGKGDPPALAGIVPHAGWTFSGRIACNTIHRLKERVPPELVVVFGMHLHAGSPNIMMDRGAWQTPFGRLPVDEDLANYLGARFSFTLESPRRFNPDNTIELQMPLIHHLLSPAAVLALGVAPRKDALEVGRAVARWAMEKGRRVKIVGSTDLTHYGANYGLTTHGSGAEALEWVREHNDRRLIDALLAMEPLKVIDEGLTNHNACCAGAAAAALAAAAGMGAVRARLVDYATSCDIIPGESFVGYAGVVFE
jgi:AmmeMemoRadiSam system protein B